MEIIHRKKFDFATIEIQHKTVDWNTFNLPTGAINQ